MMSLVYLLVGVVLGGTIGWFIRSSSLPKAQRDDRLEEELRQQSTQAQQSLATTRDLLTQAQTTAASLEATQRSALLQLEAAQAELAQSRSAQDILRDELRKTSESAATARAEAQAAVHQLAEQKVQHEQEQGLLREGQNRALADLREAFKALSSDALRQVQPEFLRLANETFAKFAEASKGDLSQRQQSIATLVKPLEEQLQSYQQRLQTAESSQSNLLGEIRKQLESLTQQSHSLSSETSQLRRVLSSNQARGRWGEETLRRVVEAAGMSTHCDFTEQAQSDDSKPDLLVHLPGERVIIVDAKVPDLEFLNGLESADEVSRSAALAEHANRLKQTIKALAERDYPAKFENSLDFVVLFLPAESLFSAALEGDRELMIWAQNRRILLATPSSLLAILRSVSVSWQHHAQTQNARDIATAAQELYGRVCKFIEHFERVRDGLEKATNAYNQAVGSYERQVRPSAERLKQLGGAIEGKEAEIIPPLETPLRLPPTTGIKEQPSQTTLTT
jgi:DNA recombination protein RmuC